MTFFEVFWRALAIGLGLAVAFLALALASAWANRRGLFDSERELTDEEVDDWLEKGAAEEARRRAEIQGRIH